MRQRAETAQLRRYTVQTASMKSIYPSFLSAPSLVAHHGLMQKIQYKIENMSRRDAKMVTPLFALVEADNFRKDTGIYR
jgi:hypothetical protein